VNCYHEPKCLQEFQTVTLDKKYMLFTIRRSGMWRTQTRAEWRDGVGVFA
jgi:hypothetical protein